MTHTGLALDVAMRVGFRRDQGHRSDAKKMVLLITDGNANGRINLKKVKAKLKIKHVNVISLGIGSNVDK